MHKIKIPLKQAAYLWGSEDYSEADWLRLTENFLILLYDNPKDNVYEKSDCKRIDEHLARFRSLQSKSSNTRKEYC